MSMTETGADLWGMMTADRGTMLDRKQRLAEMTIPSALPDSNYKAQTDALTNGASSLGAQGATNIINKLMLAMFAPGISFLRLEMQSAEKQRFMEQMELQDDSLITDVLANGEREAMKTLEQSGSRPHIYEGLAHLVTVGDVLMDLSDSAVISFISVRDYAVKRNRKGKVLRLVFCEKLRVMDLEDEARTEFERAQPECRYDDEVTIYTVVKWAKGMYRSTVWVEDVQLSQRHSGKWTAENMPYRALTWRLPIGQDYGVSLAEDYANDLVIHDAVSESLADGAVLASQFRWACNPGGMTDPSVVEAGANGSVVPASKGDLSLIFANIGQQLQSVTSVEELYSRRLGRGFLMNTAVTRNAERVSVEEVRIQANELEQSLGGVYSRLAIDMQGPIARWSLRRAKIDIKGTKIDPTIITGLDALSRSADLERLMGFLQDITNLSTLPPEIRMRLNEGPIIADMAAGRGVDRGKYVASDAEYEARMQQQAQQQMEQQAATAGASAAVAEQTGEVPQ